MPSILVHLTHGPEHPTRAVLAFLVAQKASEEGHEVTLFLAGDAVQLLRNEVLDNLAGLGTGGLRQAYDALVAAKAEFYVSGPSCQSRGVHESDLVGKPVERATPNKLVELALANDRMFTY